MSMQPNQMRLDRQIPAAQRYAASDKSDPFCLSRCLLHIRHGLCAPLQDGTDGHYDATATVETRTTATGDGYIATVYRNMVRP